MWNGPLQAERGEDFSMDEVDDAIPPELIREELKRIVASRHFRASRRGKEFLMYVVNQKISGNGELLKERLIGASLFGRKADYATGEDPVVRVQAGDVRRRLERYQSDPENHSKVVIHIPLGCYAPVFHLRRTEGALETHAANQVAPARSEAKTQTLIDLRGDSAEEPTYVSDGANGDVAPHIRTEETQSSISHDTSRHRAILPPSAAEKGAAPSGRHRLAVWYVASGVVAVVILCAIIGYAYTRFSPDWAVKEFWSPAARSTKPVLLCLPRPMLYRPSDKLFERYRLSHPEAMTTRESRQDQFLPLDPSEPIQWGDMVPARNSGPGVGGVIAAVNLSQSLTEQNVHFSLRFGDEATYAEMRDSPVVLIGGINTEWATELTVGLNFAFDQTPGAPGIREVGGEKRVWKMVMVNGVISRDYGLITRQLSGKAGQFLVQVAGISHFGTEAASELLTNKKEFARVLRTSSINLQKQNIQILVSTDITNGRAGPLHIVAVSSW